MPLPIIEVPKHDTTLPVSGLKIQYRPFLVKEQKVLLQAMEMGNESQQHNAVVDIVGACTFNEIRVDELPLADVEYLVVMIRSKSIGETTEVMYTCPHCKAKQPLTVSLSDIEVKGVDEEKIIMLHDKVGLTMRKASFGDVRRAAEMNTDLERGYAMILASIESVFDEKEVYTRNDFNDQELMGFLESLETKDFKKVEDYVINQPTIEKTIKSKCLNCEKESEYTARGLSNFFK